jgi:methionyl-tRNA formyltransferase
VAVASAYLDRARAALWARAGFSFIPDRDLPPPDSTTGPGSGPAVGFAGFPSDYSLGFLLALLELDVRLAGIVTSPGAHPSLLGENALSRIAEHLRVPLVRAWRINDEHALMQLTELGADAFVMASFDQIVGRRALQLPAQGWLNVHPSLIPLYRGPEPGYWAIADGAAETGITLHRAVPKFDAGPILAQRAVPIDERDTAGTLTRKLVAAGVELLPGAVRALLDGDPGVAPDMSLATYRPAVGHRRLEAAGSTKEALRLVRAGVPNMPAWAGDGDDAVYVFAARIATGDPPGIRHLHFPDGVLELVDTSRTCHCHHDLADCPHREG